MILKIITKRVEKIEEVRAKHREPFSTLMWLEKEEACAVTGASTSTPAKPYPPRARKK